MDEKIIEKLLALNHEFYTTFAQSFAASRSPSDPALTSILPHIPQRARVLDVGCGNGRLALLLDRERPGATYLGVDAVPELIEVARAQAGQLATISATFHVADVAHPGWSEELTSTRPSALLRTGPSTLLKTGPSAEPIPSPAEGLRAGLDRVVMLAVLYHIHSFGLRAQVLREAASLLEPDGRLILSTWQFLDSDRMRRKIVDWAEVSITEEALEPGDYLLDWKREGRGLRYCHLVDRAEVEHLAAQSGLRVRETFRAGGREGNLSLFAILDKNPCALREV
jgi:SAM-dependent methyltransferase